MFILNGGVYKISRTIQGETGKTQNKLQCMNCYSPMKINNLKKWTVELEFIFLNMIFKLTISNIHDYKLKLLCTLML